MIVSKIFNLIIYRQNDKNDKIGENNEKNDKKDGEHFMFRESESIKLKSQVITHQGEVYLTYKKDYLMFISSLLITDI